VDLGAIAGLWNITRLPAPECADAPRPAELGGNINSLTARHDHIARRHPQMFVLAASTLYYINGTDRKRSRQVARL